MSLSRKNNTNPNPSARFYSWAGGEGKLKYWDREKEETVEVDVPVTFIKLDQLSTVAGWSNDNDSFYYSNEVRSLNKEELTIRTKNGRYKKGLWSDLKDEFKADGGKYASSVYVAEVNEDGSLTLCNLKLFGSAITPWIEFSKNNKGPGFTIADAEEAKKGRTVYYTPVFESYEVDDDSRIEAIELDKELQVYFDKYFDYSFDSEDDFEDTVKEESEEKVKAKAADDDIPF